MRTIALLGAGLLALGGAVPAGAADTPAPVYLLTMRMQDNGRVVGSPRIEVAAGKPARIEIANTPDARYAMTMTITPQAGDIVLVASNIDITSGGTHRSEAPSLTIALGKPSAIAFGDEGPGMQPFRVDFTVTRA